LACKLFICWLLGGVTLFLLMDILFRWRLRTALSSRGGAASTCTDMDYLSLFIAVGTKVSLSFYEMRDVCTSSFTRSFTFTVTFNYFKTHCYTYSQTSNYHVPFHVSSAAIAEARLHTVHVARSYECMSQSWKRETALQKSSRFIICTLYVIFRVVKSRWMRWAGHVARLREDIEIMQHFNWTVLRE
jgi:hypothetical protein